MQALRGGGNVELRRHLDILDELPYQPCPQLSEREDDIAAYVPLRNSLASGNLHPLDQRANDLAQHKALKGYELLSGEQSLFPPGALREPPVPAMKPLRNWDAMEQSRLLNLNPIEIPCGLMDLASSSAGESTNGRHEMRIQNQAAHLADGAESKPIDAVSDSP